MKIEDITYALPKDVASNLDLTKENPNWVLDIIEHRAGVLERPCASEDETAFDFSVQACDELFEKHDALKDKIDAIIVCTQTPDYIMPGNSFLLHERFKLKSEVICFDYNLACSGYVYGLSLAKGLFASKQASYVLLVTGDTYSKYINPKDRSTKTLFGDGVAVTWLSKNSESSLIDILLESSGKGAKQFYIPAGGCRQPISEDTKKVVVDRSGNERTEENIYMNGLGVLSFINSTIPKHVHNLLERNSLTIDEIDKIVFHQASKMTLDSLKKLLNIPEGKSYSNLMHKGNLVSASIPVAIKDAWDAGEIKRGDSILLSSFGVGLSYASAIMVF